MLMNGRLSDHELLHLTPKQAETLIASDPALAAWAMIRLCALAQGREGSRSEEPSREADTAPAPGPSTPSSQIPPYLKPNTTRRRRKRPGRKVGHAGANRPMPEADRVESHTLERCPDCGGPLSAAYSPRERLVEDIEKAKPVVINHVIHKHYCPCCKKAFEGKVTDALPGSRIGNNALLLSAWLHYGLGMTISNIVETFNKVFHFPVSESGLAQQWQRLSAFFAIWYDEIAMDARQGAVLHADETGWRQNGITHC